MSQYTEWWGNPGKPGSSQESAWKKANLKTYTLNCGVRLSLNKRVGHLIVGFWNELEELTGYSLADSGQPDDWGFANRPNRNNPNALSLHALGIAADGNAEENPNRRGDLITNMPIESVRALAKKWGLRWGGDFSTVKDPMHVEYIKSPGEVGNYPVQSTTTPKGKFMPELSDDEQRAMYNTVMNLGKAQPDLATVLNEIKTAVQSDDDGGPGQISAATIDAIAERVADEQAERQKA